MSKDRIVELERKIGALTAELTNLRKASPGTPVPDYMFRTQMATSTCGMRNDPSSCTTTWTAVAT